jgi:hypothetical protein
MLLLCSLTIDLGLYATDTQAHALPKIIAYDYAKENLRLVTHFVGGRRHSDLSYASPNGRYSLLAIN